MSGQNIELSVFDSTGELAIDLAEEFNKQPEKPVVIKYIDFDHPDVFLMAKI